MLKHDYPISVFVLIFHMYRMPSSDIVVLQKCLCQVEEQKAHSGTRSGLGTPEVVFLFLYQLQNVVMRIEEMYWLNA